MSLAGLDDVRARATLIVSASIVEAMFADFTLERIDVGEVELRVRHGGNADGQAVVLLHGHPRTHTTWHAVAPLLANDFYVVCPDLRGYGESSKPADAPDHAQASKRAMAADVATLMEKLGFGRFAVVGHDRGAYAALRTAMDYPERVSQLVVLDAVPIGEALARANAKFAQAWPHWFFLGLPDKPERAILADPDAWYGNSPEKMGAENYADYLGAIHDPATVHAMVEDYRAGLSVDRADDQADMDAGRQLAVPTLVLWASRDDMETLYGNPLGVWRPWAPDLRGHRVTSGHHMAEEIPDMLAAEIRNFLRATSAVAR
jgi:haloacetate dehalogenase